MSTETDPHSQMISSFAFGNIVDDELTEWEKDTQRVKSTILLTFR
jgi:hypothetical protein